MLASEYVARGWCQGADAKDKDGWLAPPRDPLAVKWCAVGGILASSEMPPTNLPYNMIKLCHKLTGGRSLTAWNDWPGRTQAEVVELLRKAEALALAEE